MRGSLAANCVALHPPRVRGGGELAVLALHGADATERPRRRDRNLVAAAAQGVDRLAAGARLDRDRARPEPARIEGVDQVLRVPLRRVDRLLEVEAAFDMAEEHVQRPLLLLVPAGRPPGEPRLAAAQG